MTDFITAYLTKYVSKKNYLEAGMKLLKGFKQLDRNMGICAATYKVKNVATFPHRSLSDKNTSTHLKMLTFRIKKSQNTCRRI